MINDIRIHKHWQAWQLACLQPTSSIIFLGQPEPAPNVLNITEHQSVADELQHLSLFCTSSSDNHSWTSVWKIDRKWMGYFIMIDRFYIALFSALKQTHCTLVAVAFYSAVLNIHQNGTLIAPFGCYLMLCETAAVLVHVLCIPYNHATPTHFKNKILDFKYSVWSVLPV